MREKQSGLSSPINKHKKVIPNKQLIGSRKQHIGYKSGQVQQHCPTTLALQKNCDATLVAIYFAPTTALNGLQEKKHKIIREDVRRHLSMSSSHSCTRRRSEWRKSSFISPV
jgi:hypothetical protein